MRSYCSVPSQTNYKNFYITVYKFLNNSDYKYCFKISFKSDFVDNFYTSQQSFTTISSAINSARDYIDSLILFGNKRNCEYRQRRLVGSSIYRVYDEETVKNKT